MVLFFHHYIDPAVVAVVAWHVMVVTLEVNDFRHRLLAAAASPPPHDGGDGDDGGGGGGAAMSPDKTVASLAAIRLGLRDAVVDWSILYSVGWAIVGGITWNDAEPNYVLVMWGLSLVSAALILGNSGLRIPQWIGYYRRSQFQFVRDTSSIAPRAVTDLSSGSITVSSFRYQVRLGTGRHLSRFVCFLMPFYVQLRVWAYVLSILVGFLSGHIFLYFVFKCRERFRRHRGRVAIGASFVLSVVSALMFTRGMQVIEKGWQRNIGREELVLSLSFFFWLALCSLLQGFKYWEQLRFSAKVDADESPEAVLFESTRADSETSAGGDESEEDGPVGSTAAESNLGESLLGSTASGDRRDHFKKESMEAQNQSYFYQTAHFDRVKIRSQKSDLSDRNPRECYDSCAAGEEADMKWHVRAWKYLPFQPAWDLFALGTRETFGCCIKNSDFKEKSCGKRASFVTFNVLKLLVNLTALFLAAIACGSAIQTKVTKSKLPWVREKYTHINEGKVCAYDEKCGKIDTFAGEDEAKEAGFKVAHCGKCSYCSTWNDLEMQWSTRTNAAASSQACGMKSFTSGRGAMLTCLETDMGWTKGCAEAWAQSIECAKENCMFIAIQSMITNRMGNFKVGPDAITAATCNEAQCEQGNPGRFADLSGASRRKMNIRSSILRPPSQQCQIVDEGIPRDDGGYNDWGQFFDPPCPRGDSPEHTLNRAGLILASAEKSLLRAHMNQISVGEHIK